MKYPLSLREKNAIKFLDSGERKKAKDQFKAVLKEDLRIASLRSMAQLEAEDGNYNAAINYISAFHLVYKEFAQHEWIKKLMIDLVNQIKRKTKKIKKNILIKEGVKIKIAVIGAIWKRPNLTHIFIKHLKRMFDATYKYEIDYKCFLSVSESMWETDEVAKKYKFCSFVITENNPLSRKWQAALDAAKEWRPDLILVMGSDNFISSDRLERMLKLIEENNNCHVVGLKDCVIIDKKEVIRWMGYNFKNQPHRTGEPIGAARMITSDLLDELEWNLWGAEELNKGLDSLVMKKFEECGYIYADISDFSMFKNTEINAINVLSPNNYCDSVLDVKTAVNVTKMNGTLDKKNFENWTGSIEDVLIKITGNSQTTKELNTYLNDEKE